MTTHRTLFSPGDAVLADLLTLLAGARRRIRVCLYVLTLPVVAAALIERHQAGVDVAVLLDAGQALPLGAAAIVTQLRAAGVPVVTGTSPAGGIIHDKFVVADSWVFCGSYNLSHAAAREANQVEITRSPQRAATYLAAFQSLWDWNAAHPHATAIAPTSEEVP